MIRTHTFLPTRASDGFALTPTPTSRHASLTYMLYCLVHYRADAHILILSSQEQHRADCPVVLVQQPSCAC